MNVARSLVQSINHLFVVTFTGAER